MVVPTGYSLRVPLNFAPQVVEVLYLCIEVMGVIGAEESLEYI